MDLNQQLFKQLSAQYLFQYYKPHHSIWLGVQLFKFRLLDLTYSVIQLHHCQAVKVFWLLYLMHQLVFKM